MADSLSLDFIGATLRTVQADQRVLRSELEMLRQELRGRLDQLERSLNDKFAGIEARIDTRFDAMQSETVRTLAQIIHVLHGNQPGTAPT